MKAGWAGWSVREVRKSKCVLSGFVGKRKDLLFLLIAFRVT